MDPFPQVTDLAETPDVAGSGHLWLSERVEGLPIRFQLQPDGQLQFGDAERPLPVDEVAAPARPAVTHVQSEFDRDALRAAVDTVEGVTFFGVATCQHRIEYDWDALPAFLGVDVHSADRGGLLGPDAAYSSFERLGLTPAPTVRRELRADAFDPGRYDFPESAFADGPVAGVRVADKHGWRGVLDNAAIESPSRPSFENPEDAAERLVTTSLVESATGRDAVAVAQARLAREHRADLVASGIDPDDRAFRSAVAAEVNRHL